MNKDELLKRIAAWGENGEYGRIIDAVLALPEADVDDDILLQLATAYNSTGEFKKAIAVLEGLRARQENNWRWQYCLGYALVNAADDEECDGDSGLRLNILERARTCFSRCMILNPPEGCLEDCDAYMQTIEDELFGDEECEEEGGDFYEDDDADALEDHIKEHFGEFPSVYRELSAPDIYIDICVIPPAENRRYYTLVTFGMGSRAMDIPEQYADQPSRIELIMRLPPEWKVGESAEEWNWPLIVLKNLGRLPVSCDSWLGRSHTVDNRETFAENTRLSATMLLDPDWLPGEARVCALPSGESVEFFEVVPIYREEMIYKVDNSAAELLEKLGGAAFNRIVDIDRPSAVPQDYTPEQDGFWDAMLDRACVHAASIRKKGLAADEINALSHMAIFLRWCIESDICSEELTERFPEVVQGVKDGTRTDLREFIQKRYDGALFDTLIADDYRDFVDAYYCFGDEGFPNDVDVCAEEYFGRERCESGEFQDEAYLFMPFTEDYYTRLASKITRAFIRFDLRTSEFSRQVFFEEAAEELLGFTCGSIGSEDAAQEYAEIAEEAQDSGGVPLMIIDGTEAALGSVSAFAEELCSALVCAVNYTADDFESAVQELTALFTQDGEPPVPQAVIEAAGRAAERYGAQPLILCHDPAALTRVYIPDENGYYSVSRPADALVRAEGFRELLLSRVTTGMGLYFPAAEVEELLGCPCINLGVLPLKTAAQVFSRAGECAQDLGRVLQPVIFCDCQGKTPAARLAGALKANAQLVIAQFNRIYGINESVQTLVREELPEIPRPKAAERYEKAMGALPAIIATDGLSTEMTVFLPRSDRYLPVRVSVNALECTRLNSLAAFAGRALECRCAYFGIMRGEQAFLKAYSQALEEGNAQGYVPLLIKASPEMLVVLSGTAGRRREESAFESRLGERLKEAECAGDIPQGVPLTRFVTVRSAAGGVSPLLLAKLPCGDMARRVAALGLFSGADEREVSQTLELWREKYGAVPALLGADTLEFYVPRPAQREDARELAAQMLALCEGLSALTGFNELAGSLAGSGVWFFCHKAAQ